MRGTVRRLYGSYGFIEDDTEKRGYFVGPSGLQLTTVSWDQVEEGMRVEFTPIEHPKGLRAIEVRVLGGGQ